MPGLQNMTVQRLVFINMTVQRLVFINMTVQLPVFKKHDCTTSGLHKYDCTQLMSFINMAGSNRINFLDELKKQQHNLYGISQRPEQGFNTPKTKKNSTL